ncbi:TPA: glycosyltransferase [Vibrio vulnificus]|nr:glycosyltransferase [Vibrio vulnificus]
MLYVHLRPIWYFKNIYKMNMISIIIVNYNSAALLLSTLQNLSHILPHKRVELVIIDGQSDDDSLDVIGKFPFVDKILVEKDSGIYDAMNKGINLSSGDWLWFVNSGDKPNITIDELLSILDSLNEKINICYSDLLLSNGTVISQNHSILFLIKSMLNHQNLLYKRQLLCKGYDLSFKICADYAHLIKNYRKCNFQKIASPLCIYDIHGMSSALDRKTRKEVWQEKFRALKLLDVGFFYKCVFLGTVLIIRLIKAVSPHFGSKVK